MNTISIIAIVVAVSYSLIVGKMAGNYRNEIKREYDAKRKEQGLRAISRDVYIEMLKETIKEQKQKIRLQDSMYASSIVRLSELCDLQTENNKLKETIEILRETIEIQKQNIKLLNPNISNEN